MIQQFHFSICPKELKARSQRGICILRFTAALSAIAKQWKQSVHLCIDRWMDKQNAVCIHSMEYYSALQWKQVWHMLQHGWALRTLSSVKQASHQKANTVRLRFWEVSAVVKRPETESRVLPRAEEKRKRGRGFQFRKMLRVLEMDGGGSCTVGMYWMPPYT